MKVGELVPTRNVTQCRERSVAGLKIQMKVGELVPTRNVTQCRER